ncbi:hypothetical protein TICRE_24480 [Tissierella creatinophila DSM 6911]|uniref:Uncharacterized protein n=1 Tax=Tissierella creatinophila DSM 6911 TaxID=1123403 RepID=A0A1U7M2T3_TISCR|nr:hypothetical protein TICRE_24480 [Tissierella creatinophila DSM 6911]
MLIPKHIEQGEYDQVENQITNGEKLLGVEQIFKSLRY